LIALGFQSRIKTQVGVFKTKGVAERTKGNGAKRQTGRENMGGREKVQIIWTESTLEKEENLLTRIEVVFMKK